MPVDPIASAPAGSAASAGLLRQDTFLQLLVAQLRYQDPLQPLQDTALLGQLAQLRMLEQLDQVTQLLAYQTGVVALVEAASLIGKEVTIQPSDATSPPFSGRVTRAALQDGEVVVTVAGREVPLSSVAAIAAPAEAA